MRRLRTATVALSVIAASGALASGATAAACPDSPIRPTVEGNYPAGCYVYEMVSPVEKGNGEAGGGLTVGNPASKDGSRILWGADGRFLDAPSLFQINGYSSGRGPGGWVTGAASGKLPSFVPEKLDFSGAGGTSNMFPNGASEDGRFTVMGTDRNPETGQKQGARLYRVNLENGEVRRITPDPVAGDDRVASESNYQAGVIGNDDFSEIYFSTTSQLTPAATGVPAFDEKLYRWTNGVTEFVSYSPSGAAQSGVIASSLADDDQGSAQLVRNSISADGSAFWFGNTYTFLAGYDLYRGEPGSTSSTRITASENPAAPSAGKGVIKGASRDGRRAVFTSRQPLVPGATAGSSGRRHAYLYTHSANPDTDTNLTWLSRDDEPADGVGFAEALLGVSDDADVVYFASSNQLVAGETTVPGTKLYRWADGTLRFIGLSPEAINSYGEFRVSADGRYLAFAPTRPELATTGRVYHYDAERDRIECVSCPSSGTPVGRDGLAQKATTFGITSRPPRNLATDGRVIFETDSALLPQDTNGQRDVYSWKDGVLSLVSTGRSTSHSRFADASEDGSSMFIYTREALSGWDEDKSQDLYVARLNGGLPEPNVRPAEQCTEDACQGAWTPAPTPPVVGSVTFTGTGNVVAPPWTSDAPRVSRVKAVRSRTATVKVRVPAAGTVRASGNRLQRTTRRATKARTLNVRVRLSANGERQRKRRGSVKVTVSVRYTPTAGRASTVRVPVTFRAAKSKGSASRSASTNKKGGR